ncbi:MAG TPA: aldo/keto reductase [Solirubrobacteraceae bacterium]
MRGSTAIGRTGVRVTRLSLGGAPLGGLYETVAGEQAAATVQAAWAAGVRSFDTAPQYGLGASEARLGHALTERPRADYILATKVGRLVVGAAEGDEENAAHAFAGTADRALRFDFSRDGVRRSLAASLDRLGLDRVDVVHVHDPEDHLDAALAEAFPALAELRAEGAIGAVGAGMNYVAPLRRIVAEADVDCVLVAGRYTLLDHDEGRVLLDECAARGVSVLAAGVFNSGVLADPRPGARFDYAPASPDVIDRARRIAAVCARHDVPLTHAAIAFPLAHPAVASVVVGARSAEEVSTAVAAVAQPVPPALWEDLRAEGLLAAEP